MASVATSAGPLWLPEGVVSVLVATPSLPGHQGSAVTEAALTLDHGTQVTVTVGGGHFIA
jgi:hypothetical protein